MFPVEHVWNQASEIFGHCNEEVLLRDITDSVQLLANKGEIDPLVGQVDICVSGQCVTLPPEIETVLAVNIGGHPALGRDELFSFHLNGPGDFDTACNYTWTNVGGFPTYRDIQCPARLIAFLDNIEDQGKELRVFGFDHENRPLRTKVGERWEDGYLVPTIFGYALPDSTAPYISRITSIRKAVTVANIRLSSFDNSSSTGTLLGVFEHDETEPRYRRIRLHRNAEWVRIMYRRRSLDLRSRKDRILLHSRPALLLAMRALKSYSQTDIAAGVQFEAQATRLLSERESVLTAPVMNPVQVSDRSTALGGDNLGNE
jgi:hypothetical protein